MLSIHKNQTIQAAHQIAETFNNRIHQKNYTLIGGSVLAAGGVGVVASAAVIAKLVGALFFTVLMSFPPALLITAGAALAVGTVLLAYSLYSQASLVKQKQQQIQRHFDNVTQFNATCERAAQNIPGDDWFALAQKAAEQKGQQPPAAPEAQKPPRKFAPEERLLQLSIIPKENISPEETEEFHRLSRTIQADKQRQEEDELFNKAAAIHERLRSAQSGKVVQPKQAAQIQAPSPKSAAQEQVLKAPELQPEIEFGSVFKRFLDQQTSGAGSQQPQNGPEITEGAATHGRRISTTPLAKRTIGGS